jgi:hypothetical protein
MTPQTIAIIAVIAILLVLIVYHELWGACDNSDGYGNADKSMEDEH